jgi:hypothetical protein
VIHLPELYRIRQHVDTGEVTDLADAVGCALEAASLTERVRPGTRVAVTAGSRGIDRIAEVLRLTVDWLRGRGALPFIVPAMGSHGGPTPAGPVQLLARLGITEETVGAPVEGDPETVVLGRVRDLPVHCSRAAAGADGIVVVNRVKPHTSFSGDYESGLAKMLAVGLGGRQGAACVHTCGVRLVPRIIPEMAQIVLRRTPVLAGIALLENGLDRLGRIEGIPADRILEREPQLLDQARELRPALPFEEADVLVVDCLGKNLSGTGMDTHVIGRLFIGGEPEPDRPRIRRIAVLRLSPESEGNAYGVGLADVTTDALVSRINRESMQANAMTSTFVERARVPLALPSDRLAIEAAVQTCNHPDLSTLRLARIRDTLHLEELHVSEGLLDSLSNSVEVLEGPLAWAFDGEGNLEPDCEKKVPE